MASSTPRAPRSPNTAEPNPEDRDVPILVYAPGVVAPGSHSESVETTQIAPTILHLLGLNPNDLQAVRIEGTKTLPGS